MRLINLSEPKRKETASLLMRELNEREEVLFSYLHGSFQEGGSFRDVDIAVFVREEEVPKSKALDYALSLSVDLEDRIRLPVDVKVLNYAPLAFQYHSTKGRPLTLQDDERRVDFLTTVWNRYHDYAPKSKEFLTEMLP